jgi:exonuclease VII small subunit
MSSNDQILAEYEAGIEMLEEMVAGLSNQHLDLKREPGKWSIRETVHHIADAEDIWKVSIKAALGNSGCTFDLSWYIDDNVCAKPLDYEHRPIEHAIELFKAGRRYVTGLMKHLPDAWDRYLIFNKDSMPEPKKFDITAILRFQNLHLNLHLKQISETRKVHNI